MAKQSGYKPATKVREAPPRAREIDGEMKLLCPFCAVPHPLSIGQASPCGTSLQINAVQIVVPVRTVRQYGLKCIKCGKSGGEMTPFNKGYTHLVDCMPQLPLLAEPPKKYSRLARWIYGLPGNLRTPLERFTGAVKRVDEIDSHGQDTGRTLGYIFYKEKESA